MHYIRTMTAICGDRPAVIRVSSDFLEILLRIHTIMDGTVYCVSIHFEWMPFGLITLAWNILDGEM